MNGKDIDAVLFISKRYGKDKISAIVTDN